MDDCNRTYAPAIRFPPPPFRATACNRASAPLQTRNKIEDINNTVDGIHQIFTSLSCASAPPISTGRASLQMLWDEEFGKRFKGSVPTSLVP